MYRCQNLGTLVSVLELDEALSEQKTAPAWQLAAGLTMTQVKPWNNFSFTRRDFCTFQLPPSAPGSLDNLSNKQHMTQSRVVYSTCCMQTHYVELISVYLVSNVDPPNAWSHGPMISGTLCPVTRQWCQCRIVSPGGPALDTETRFTLHSTHWGQYGETQACKTEALIRLMAKDISSFVFCSLQFAIQRLKNLYFQYDV